MALASWWIFKDRLTRWVPEKEADENRRATRSSKSSVEERLRRGRAENDALREGLRGPRKTE